MILFAAALILLTLLGATVIWWYVLPIRELLSQIRRVASGDYRPFIHGRMPAFLSRTTGELRLITELLARQQALRSQEEFSLGMILGKMTEGVVIIGSDRRIRLVNEAATAMFNLRGKSAGFLLQEVFLSHELQEIARRAEERGEVQQGEITVAVLGRGEKCHLVVTAAPLRSAAEKTRGGVLLVLHDITRLRDLESVRREFVANVSHEFRTPLSIITGYLETLEDGRISKEMLRKSITVMRRHGERLNNLIEDLLTISRMEEKAVRLESAPADLIPILKSAMEQLEREVEARGATVHLETTGNLPLVEVDAYRMEQAFSNLLANALRHGRPQGGSVEITVSAQGPEVRIGFRDNGPGIPFQDQEHLFERFYRVGGDRARNTGGGTGLGLSIVKHVVAAHGGRIGLESKPGEGALFSIFLPVNPEA